MADALSISVTSSWPWHGSEADSGVVIIIIIIIGMIIGISFTTIMTIITNIIIIISIIRIGIVTTCDSYYL